MATYEDKIKERLRKNLVTFAEDLRVDVNLCSHLVQDGVFSEANKDDILVEKKTQDRNNEFLKIVKTRGEDGLKCFIKALVATNQQSLAEILDPQLATNANSVPPLIVENPSAQIISRDEDHSDEPTSSTETGSTATRSEEQTSATSCTLSSQEDHESQVYSQPQHETGEADNTTVKRTPTGTDSIRERGVQDNSSSPVHRSGQLRRLRTNSGTSDSSGSPKRQTSKHKAIVTQPRQRYSLGGNQDDQEFNKDYVGSIECTVDFYQKEMNARYPDKLKNWYPPILDVRENTHTFIKQEHFVREFEQNKKDTSSTKLAVCDDICKTVADLRCGSRAAMLGDGGYGKSTTLSHLAESWNKGDKYLKDFCLTILIPLSCVRSDNLGTVVCDNLGLLPKGEDNHFKELEKSEYLSEKMLFLLDGFEELHHMWLIEEKKSDIRQLLEGTFFPCSTVIVSSRPHCMLQKASLLSKVCKYQIQLLPFTTANMKTFISKRLHMTEIEAEGKLREMERLLPPELSQVPMYLELMCFLDDRREQDMQHSSHPAKPLTRTDLFVSIAEICLKRFQGKTGQRLCVNLNLKKFKDIADRALQRLIESLSAASFATIECEAYDITKTFTIEECGQLGFLRVEGDSQGQVCFSHTLIRDFFAAYHLHLHSEKCVEILQERNAWLATHEKCGLRQLFGSLGDVFLFMAGLNPKTLSIIASEIEIYVTVLNISVPLLNVRNTIDETGSVKSNVAVEFECNSCIDLSFESSLLHEAKVVNTTLDVYARELVQKLTTKHVLYRRVLQDITFLIPPSPEIPFCILRMMTDSERLAILQLIHQKTLDRESVPIRLFLPGGNVVGRRITDPLLLYSLNKIQLVNTPTVAIGSLYIPLTETMKSLNNSCTTLSIFNSVLLPDEADYPFLKETCELTNPLITSPRQAPREFCLTDIVLHSVAGLKQFCDMKLSTVKNLHIENCTVDFYVKESFPNLTNLHLQQVILKFPLCPEKLQVLELTKFQFIQPRWNELQGALSCLKSVERLKIIGSPQFEGVQIRLFVKSVRKIKVGSLALVGWTLLEYPKKQSGQRTTSEGGNPAKLQLILNDCTFTANAYNAFNIALNVERTLNVSSQILWKT